jgi:recombinational DNA repair ATPase RecF
MIISILYCPLKAELGEIKIENRGSGAAEISVITKALILNLTGILTSFLGANAQGKTNLLEALTFLAAARSFRTRNESEMVLWGEPFCFTSGKVVHRYGESILKVTYNAEAKKKTFNINGKEVNKGCIFTQIYYSCLYA